MQPPGPRGWGAPQGPRSPLGPRPPNPPGGFQRFQQGPPGSGVRFSSGFFQQQGPQANSRMPFNHKDKPFIRPSQFSGPPSGQAPNRPPFTNNSNPNFGNRNPFGPGPRFGNLGQNGPPGMMRGARPNFNRPNGPSFHQNQFHKNKPKQHQNPNNSGEKKEVKFFCDTCDRGYKDEDKYQEHISGHEKCKYEGCTYIAAPKLVQLHINLQHRSGLAKKIWSLESPEDIKKWREDRKKNFPTAANIAQKKADHASREERGEVIQEKYFGRMYGGRGRGRDRGRGRGHGGRFDRRRGGNNNDSCGPTEAKQRKLENANEEKEKTNSKNVNEQTSNKHETKHPDGDPLSIILAGQDSDDERAQKSSPSQLTAAGGLGTLMSSYTGDSSDEEGGIKESEVSISAVENRLGITGNEKTCQDPKEGNHNDIHGTSHHENGNQKSDWNLSDRGHHRNRKRGKKHQQNKKWEPATSGKFEPPPRIFDRSLLAKLLAKDVRRERNKILQCVHYIVKKDFFGVGNTAGQASSSDASIK